jgi:hypothetical protein
VNSQVSGSPPRPPLCLGLGVTGHRRDLLPEGAQEAVRRQVDALLSTVAAAADAILASHAVCFAGGPPVLRLASPLADGADQIVAEAALAAGFELQAVLPFAREDYLPDFDLPESAAQFDALLARAACILELPGDPARRLEAYIMAGRATVAHSDVLIAVWDGLPARGRGGTGEVVEHALRRGTPVIHLPVEPDRPVQIVWSGFDPLVSPSRPDEMPRRPADAGAVGRLVEALLAPPAEPAERRFIAAFYGERERQLHPRIEYPLLLALTGARALRRSAWRVGRYAETTASEWAGFRERCADRRCLAPGLDRVETAYCWADGLAQHFAQTYRSGHVFNFLFAAFAVVAALGGLLASGSKAVLSAVELLLIALLIANTHIGTRREWHRRWLDYRQLAERLRPLRSLKLLALAQPGFAADAAGRGQRRWIDWYAASVWRGMGCPPGRISADAAPALAALVSAEELRPQIEWHRASARQTRHLDHRLHQIGTALFAATIVSTTAFLIGYLSFHDWTTQHSNWFVFLSGGLPALGTAIFGIRVQGDFAGTSARSLATAQRLEGIAAELDKPDVSLTRAADLVEEAARTMIGDLAEWRLAHQQRKLVIPA